MIEYSYLPIVIWFMHVVERLRKTNEHKLIKINKKLSFTFVLPLVDHIHTCADRQIG